MPTIQLGQIAHARSGDKGNHANIGVVAYTDGWLCVFAAASDRRTRGGVFRRSGHNRVDRFELPKLGALNFVLHNALAGGASQSLRIDTQGKLLGTAMLDLPLPAPAGDELSKMLPT